MRRTTALAASPALALLLSGFTGPQASATQSNQNIAPPPAISLPGTRHARAGQSTDLSGAYRGQLELEGQSIPAHLVIEGDRFTLTTASGTSSAGRIKTSKGARGDINCELKFDSGAGSPVHNDLTLHFRARKVGNRLMLSPAPGELQAFTFRTALPREHTGAEYPVSIDGNTSNANAVFNTNANTTTNTSTHDGNTNHTTKDSNDGNSGHRGHGSRNTRVPNVHAIATGGENDNAESPVLSSSPSSSSGDPEIDALLAKLHEGQLALKAPDSVRQGETVSVSARIAFDDIGERVKTNMPGTGETSTETVKVGQVMKVVLLAEEPDAYAIHELTDAEQIIVGKPFAEWRWSVTPLRSGRHTLHLRATTNLLVPGRGEKPYPVPVIDKEIEVRVSYGYVVKNFLTDKDNLKFVLGGLTIPGALAGIWKFFQKRRAKKTGGGDNPSADD